MTQRFMLRHPSLAQAVGPYTIDQLSASIEAGAFPGDSEVRPESDDDAAWQTVASLLGLPEQPRRQTAPAAQPTTAPSGNHPALLEKLRSGTAYSTFRTLVNVVAVLAVIFTIVSTLLTLSLAAAPTGLAMAALAQAAVVILVILIVAIALQILADIADCALRRENQRHPN